MCKVLEVSRSGYYDWRRRPVSKRDQENEQLVERIQEVHEESEKTYGSPRVYHQLRQEGYSCGENRVSRLMREKRIFAQIKRKFRCTTMSDHDYPIADNLVDRNFNVSQPNQCWGSDITYIDTGEGWLYLAVVMDLCTRRIVGWSMQRTLEKSLTLSALHMAIQNQLPKKGLIHHSDRGIQYACKSYQKILRQFKIDCSMSRKGNCWDNAPIESFFGTLKTELVYRRNFKTREEAKQAIFKFIEVFYNRKRLHSSLGYLSPMVYEQQYHSLN